MREVGITTLRLQRTTGGIGATFPDDLLADLNAGEGDMVDFRLTPNGILLMRRDAPVDEVVRTVPQPIEEDPAAVR